MAQGKKSRTRHKIQHKIPPVGAKLAGRTRGQYVFAEVVQAETKTSVGILFDGTVYESMSGAARAATGYSINGWVFWKSR